MFAGNFLNAPGTRDEWEALKRRPRTCVLTQVAYELDRIVHARSHVRVVRENDRNVVFKLTSLWRQVH